MWRYACVFLLLVSGLAHAGEVFLIPENNLKPVYPPALKRAGITGDVRVMFTAHADGSVSQISILKSDHPDLAEASRAAIAQWRFKPWTVEGDKPAEQEVIAPMFFHFDFPNGTQQWLKDLKCREANKAFIHTAEYAWPDSAPFHYTRAYLANSLPTMQLPVERRLALIAKLNRQAPTIARQCLNDPVRKYMSLLPEEIRKLF